MAGLTDDDVERTPWFSTYRRFLSTASQVAHNASAAISSQLCHNIYPPRSFPINAGSRPQNHSITSALNHHSKAAVKAAHFRQTQAQTEAQDANEFDSYLQSQGPRALEIASENEYRQFYADEMRWRKDMGVDARGKALPSEAVARLQGVFERSVEKRLGTEELGRDWIRFCNKYGSRGTQQFPPSPCNITLAPYARMEDDKGSESSDQESWVDTEGQKWRTYPSIPGPPQPVEPAERPSPLAAELNKVGNILTDISSLISPVSPPALSATSPYLLTTPLPQPDVLQSPSSPSPEPSYTIAVDNKKAKTTPYLALYPGDHRLGFNCVCSACKLKVIKKQKPDAIPTLAERRIAKRNFQTIEMPPTPDTSSDEFSFEGSDVTSDAVTPNPPIDPVGYFMSGNVMVPMYNYTEQLRGVAPSTWMLGDTIVYGVKSRERNPTSRKRGRNSGMSSPELDEENGDSKRRRRK